MCVCSDLCLCYCVCLCLVLAVECLCARGDPPRRPQARQVLQRADPAQHTNRDEDGKPSLTLDPSPILCVVLCWCVFTADRGVRPVQASSPVRHTPPSAYQWGRSTPPIHSPGIDDSCVVLCALCCRLFTQELAKRLMSLPKVTRTHHYTPLHTHRTAPPPYLPVPLTDGRWCVIGRSGDGECAAPRRHQQRHHTTLRT